MPSSTNPPIKHLSRNTIIKALEIVAAYIAYDGTHLRIVAIGGAVNVILLKSRGLTDDVDYFGYYLSKDEKHLLRRASIYAADAMNIDAPWWLNDHVTGVMRGREKQLTDLAVEQDEVIFERAGLTVFAAPWRWAIVAKLDLCITRRVKKKYDWDDAYHYFCHLADSLEPNAQRISASDVKEWAKFFGEDFNPLGTKMMLKKLERSKG